MSKPRKQEQMKTSTVIVHQQGATYAELLFKLKSFVGEDLENSTFSVRHGQRGDVEVRLKEGKGTSFKLKTRISAKTLDVSVIEKELNTKIATVHVRTLILSSLRRKS